MSTCNDEDEGNLESGDLGLGFGLKPGSLPILDALRSKKKALLKSHVDLSAVSAKPLIPPNQSHYSTIEKLRHKSKTSVNIYNRKTYLDKMNPADPRCEGDKKLPPKGFCYLLNISKIYNFILLWAFFSLLFFYLMCCVWLFILFIDTIQLLSYLYVCIYIFKNKSK